MTPTSHEPSGPLEAQSSSRATAATADTADTADTDESHILRRILDAVEKDQRKRWVEIACAILLALATTASAWCAYQSNLWGGVQTFRLAASARNAREASRNEVIAAEERMFDGLMFIHFIEHRSQQREDVGEFLRKRFSPEMKVAVEAWLATDPFNNPQAPLTPLKMPQYVQAEKVAAQKLHDEAVTMHDAAQVANQHSDTYVLLTVLFASVLFFGGIAGTINNDSRRLRWAMQLMAVVLFLITTGFMFTMPICRE